MFEGGVLVAVLECEGDGFFVGGLPCGGGGGVDFARHEVVERFAGEAFGFAEAVGLGGDFELSDESFEEFVGGHECAAGGADDLSGDAGDCGAGVGFVGVEFEVHLVVEDFGGEGWRLGVPCGEHVPPAAGECGCCGTDDVLDLAEVRGGR